MYGINVVLLVCPSDDTLCAKTSEHLTSLTVENHQTQVSMSV